MFIRPITSRGAYMLGRKKKSNEEWHVKAYKAGSEIYKLSSELASSILAYAARNDEQLNDSDFDDVHYYSAALLFAVLDTLAYMALDDKGRRGRDAFMSKALEGFMSAHKSYYAQKHNEEATDTEITKVSICIEAFMADIRQNFNTAIKGSALVITKEYCEVFANRLIQKFSMSVTTAKFAVNKASKVISELHASTLTMF
jgi:hypothetical protein